MFLKEKSFVFASEIHALKKCPFFDISLSKENILALIHEPSCLDPSGLTPYQDLHILPPGHSMTIDKKLETVRLKKWWTLPENEIDYSKKEIKAEFDRLFNNACELRLRSDVPLANALSGGLDSSSIYAKVNRMETDTTRFCPGNHRSCFNMRFENSLDSEHEFAVSRITFPSVLQFFCTGFGKFMERFVVSNISFCRFLRNSINLHFATL